MKEIELLKSMWPTNAERTKSGEIRKKVRRGRSLIVPKITEEPYSLNNGHWHFKVGYGFREALDIRYESEVVDGQIKSYWSQGAALRFKEGDLIESSSGDVLLKIKFANFMGWDSAKEEMDEGNVTYQYFKRDGDRWTFEHELTVTQMKFLELLIGQD